MKYYVPVIVSAHTQDVIYNVMSDNSSSNQYCIIIMINI